KGDEGVLWGLLVASELRDHGRSREAARIMRALAKRSHDLYATGWEEEYAAELLADLPLADPEAFDDLQRRLFSHGSEHLYKALQSAGHFQIALDSARRFGRPRADSGLINSRITELCAEGSFAEAWSLADSVTNGLHGGSTMEIAKAQA